MYKIVALKLTTQKVREDLEKCRVNCKKHLDKYNDEIRRIYEVQ